MRPRETHFIVIKNIGFEVRETWDSIPVLLCDFGQEIVISRCSGGRNHSLIRG